MKSLLTGEETPPFEEMMKHECEKLSDGDMWENILTRNGRIQKQQGALLLWKHFKENDTEIPDILQEEIDAFLMKAANRAERDLPDMFQDYHDKELKKVLQEISKAAGPHLTRMCKERGMRLPKDAAAGILAEILGKEGIWTPKAATIKKRYMKK